MKAARTVKLEYLKFTTPDFSIILIILFSTPQLRHKILVPVISMMIKEHNFQSLLQALNKSLRKFIYHGKSKLIGSSVACIVISDEVNSAEY